MESFPKPVTFTSFPKPVGGAGIAQLYCYSSRLTQSLMILIQRSWVPQLQAHIVSDWLWIFAGGHTELWLVTDLHRWSPQVASGHGSLQVITVTGHGSLQVITLSCDWSWIFLGDNLKSSLVIDLYRWSLWMVIDVYRWSPLLLMVIDLYRWLFMSLVWLDILIGLHSSTGGP